MKKLHYRVLSLALLSVLAACSTPGASAPVAAQREHGAPADPVVATAANATFGAVGMGDEMFPTFGNGGYDVERYDLAFALDAVDGPIDASATITARAEHELSRFNLDFHGLEIKTIQVDASTAMFAREGDELVITPSHAIAAGATFRTVVVYGGVPQAVADPSIPVEKLGWLPSDGELYVFSEPNGAKTFFPCNDHPRDKALYTLRITVPKPLMAVANGTLVETVDADTRRTFVWSARDPMASYLLTIAIANFETAELEGPNGLKIVNYFTPSSKASSRRGFEKTPEIIKFLGDTFGPYPFEICGGILSNLEIGGALETQTIPVYGAGVGMESVICHELAHQWFGDSVTLHSWRDIWWNEGFAEYAAWMYTESTKGKERFDKMIQARYAMLRKATLSPPANPTMRELFGAGTYVRGPLALHALRGAVGDEVFLQLVRSFLVQHKNGNVTVEDFLAHVEAGSTKAAREVLHAWLYDEEMPHVTAFDAAIAVEDKAREERRAAREAEKAAKEAAKAAKDAASGEAKKDG